MFCSSCTSIEGVQSFKDSVLKVDSCTLYRKPETGSGGVKAVQLKDLSSLLIF